jgi:plastocyanin
LKSPIRTAEPRRRRLRAALLSVFLVAAPAVAVRAADAPAGGKEYTVTMSNMAYGAMPSGLKVGDTIVWMNQDTVIHSVTARDHSFDLRINPGQTARLPLTKDGRIAFYCLFHPTMRGTMTVAAK